MMQEQERKGIRPREPLMYLNYLVEF